MIPLAKYGIREMLAATVAFGALAVVAALTFPPAAVLPAAAWACVMLFFRDPPRRPAEPDALLSPADGKVVEVSPVAADSMLGVEGVRIGIFMGLLDVHVNRSPLAGTVERITHSPGGYLDARCGAAAERNESTAILLRCRWAGRSYPLLVRQIAGLVARRIVTDLRVGQQLAAAERIGMVKFGSRVELWAPTELAGELAVSVGQKVRAGRSVLARLPAGDRQEAAQ
jgi:phosphatidylserine decarboxylase